MVRTTRFITKEECDATAEAILRRANLYPIRTRPRVDIERLAESYPGASLDQHAPIEESNVLGRTTFGPRTAHIEINRKVTEGSESAYALSWEASLFRTTIGHELGHVILHREIAAGVTGGLMRCAGTDIRSRPHSANYDPVEYQANMMMATLLMPAKIFREAYTAAEITNDNKFDIINDLADGFDVSSQAIKIRISELNLA